VHGKDPCFIEHHQTQDIVIIKENRIVPFFVGRVQPNGRNALLSSELRFVPTLLEGKS
jgi:hypothetical protein